MARFARKDDTKYIYPYKRGGVDIQEASLRVSGIDNVVNALQIWGAMTVYVTSFTSKKVAQSVFMSALRHVPEDTAELMDSGFMESADSGRVGSLAFTVNIAENLEGTPDYTALRPNFQMSFTQMDYFGTRLRTFNKYVVGFTADHAAVVHETTPPGGYRQPSDGTRSPGRRGDHSMKYPDKKTSHYLLNAYNQHRDKFSGAMIANMRALETEFKSRIGGDPYKNRDLGTSGLRPGAPRLRPRPR